MPSPSDTFSLLVGLGAVLYLQEFIRHPGYDVRVLLVGRRAFGMRRVNPLDWRTNISRGATAEPLELTAELVELARRAAAAVGASLAGVDLLLGPDGQWRVIEVNAVPGWQAIGRTLGVDVAADVLDFSRRSRGLARRPRSPITWEVMHRRAASRRCPAVQAIPPCGRRGNAGFRTRGGSAWAWRDVRSVACCEAAHGAVPRLRAHNQAHPDRITIGSSGRHPPTTSLSTYMVKSRR